MGNSLIVGAASAIAQALAKQIASNEDSNKLVCISSKDAPDELPVGAQWQRCDYQEASVNAVVGDLLQQSLNFERIFICNGQLHSDTAQPEKKFEDLQLDTLQAIFNANTFVPALWLSRLRPLLNQKKSVIVVFSARVGSISDNRLGGWYSYRASKAALNMVLKTAAVELKRRSKNTALIAFHPGTTDTPLSLPFQKSLPEGQLRTPVEVVDGLLTLCKHLTAEDSGKFFDWKGDVLPW